MFRNSSSSNNEIDSVNKEYKKCAGKDYTNPGINRLKILYINKIGWFCDSCAQTLKNLELVEEVN